MKREKLLIVLAAVLSLGATLYFAGCGGSGGGAGDTSVLPQATKAGEVIEFVVPLVEGEPTSVPDDFVPTCTQYDTAGILATTGNISNPTDSFTDGTLAVGLDVYHVSQQGWFLDWVNTTSETVDILAVVVNSVHGGYLYEYDGTVDADEGLHADASGGSGAWAEITHVSFCYKLANGGGNGEGEGCSLGYWGATKGGKNEGEVVHQASWDEIVANTTFTYTTTTELGDVFTLADVPEPTDTLLTALHYKGGPSLEDKKNLLLKQAVAALLNAAHAGVGYPMTGTGVIDAVNTALASGEQRDILSLQMLLNGYNNLGCPLN